MFLNRIKQRVRDMGTIKALCQGAERHAHRDGQARPGAEHFLLSALELPDGSARRAFLRVQADPDRLRVAITRQYTDALQSVGIDGACLAALDAEPTLPVAVNLLYEAQPSGKAVMQSLVAQRAGDQDSPLLGAHVLVAVAGMKRSVAARSLGTMGVQLDALEAAAKAEIAGAPL